MGNLGKSNVGNDFILISLILPSTKDKLGLLIVSIFIK
jgi:hypothetical protein